MKYLFLIIPILLHASEATQHTLNYNEQFVSELIFGNTQDFEDARRGFVAPLPNNGVIKDNEGRVVWDLSQYKFLDNKQKITDPKSPATVNPSLWRQARLLNKTGLFKVMDGIYQIRGADLSNMTIIEGKGGIIVIDPLLSQETARIALKLYEDTRGKRPIKAVIYTHSHADHFGGAGGIISQGDVDDGHVRVIAPEGFTKAAISENVLAGNVMSRRAAYMYGNLLKPGITGQMTAGLGLITSTGTMGLIVPTELVGKTGESKVIDGVAFVFLMAPDSEAPAEMLFYLPAKRALCAAEDATHTMHNIYSLRGAKIRNAKAWSTYLNEAIEHFGPKTQVVFSQHHWPKWGNRNVIDFLEKQRDLYKYIHDQSLHLANQGYTMVEIGERIKLPDSLAKEWYNRGYYGSLNHNAKSIYAYYLGWFNGNPSCLHPLPEPEAAKKYVAYMGGANAILERAEKDYKEGEYRWVAEVLRHLIYANPSNQKAKLLLANAYQQLGFQTENATWRNFYLTGAEELLRKEEGQHPIFTNLALITSLPTADFLDFMSISLDGLRASEYSTKINLILTDTKERYFIEIKNGVFHATPNQTKRAADLTLTLTKLDFYDLILGQVHSNDLIKGKKLTLKGSVKTLQDFQSLFISFDPSFNLVFPILNS